jgi:peptidyl-prolyl cis-trans isomerase SurA
VPAKAWETIELLRRIMTIAMPITSATLSCLHRLLLAAALTVMAAGAPLPALAQHVVVLVNGEPVTALDIEQRGKFYQLSHKTMTRQELLDELINEKLKIHEARRFKLVASDSDVDGAFANMASRFSMNSQQLTDTLTKAGSSAGSLKSRIRAETVWGQLVRGRFQSTLQVGEKDVLNAIETRKKDDKDAGYEYTLRPILFIVAKGSPPAAFDMRRREAEALKSRFQSCDEGIGFARALKDVAVRQAVVRTSADLPAALRGLLDGMQVGRLTTPDQTPNGIELFALCGKKETKADTPVKREMREEIFAERFQTQANRYLQEIRRGAMIEYR